MTNNTTYHGWTNWETWNCDLWLTSDNDYYDVFIEYAQEKNIKAIKSLASKLIAKGYITDLKKEDLEKVNFEEIIKNNV